MPKDVSTRSQCLGHMFGIWLVIWSSYLAQVTGDILVYQSSEPHTIKSDFPDYQSKFGGFIPLEGVKGLLVYAEPATACVFIQKPPNVTYYDGKWIVLIARYNCTFEEKVRMAQASGYDAAIIHNVDSDELEYMSAKTSIGITIPSVFVGEDTGLYLRDSFQYDTDSFIIINGDVPFNINTHLLLPFAIVVGICFLVMVIFMVIKCIKDRRRQRRHRLPNSSLKKIPTHKYTKGDPYETCAICLEDYAEGEKLRVLPCAHAYHTKCIDPWLTNNRRVCPVCKRKVFVADERASSSESDSDADDATPLIRDGRQGTQGGTFTPQRENPFARARQSHHRRQSDSSISSYNSATQLLNSDDGENRTDGESSGGLAFVVSDTHSINGEPADLERSARSTRPHPVNEEVAEAIPTVQVTPQRNPRILVNPVAPNSGHPIMAPNRLVPISTIFPEERNDFVA